MRKAIFTCALVLGVSAACGIAGVGCSGDDTDQDVPDSATGTDAAKDTSPPKDATGDTAKADTGGNVDSGDDDDAGQDTGTPDTSTPDTGTDSGTDAGHDSGTDSGTDAGHDSGTDTGTDSGTDASDSGTDSGTDASDAGSDTGADASDGSTIGFNNPVQIDVTTVLDVNTVVTTTPLNGAILSPMDKTNYDLLTQSKATQLGVNYAGLPDDASFAASGTVHPAVKLHWNNSAFTLNSRVVKDATPFTFAVTPHQYSNIQLYGLSTEGPTTLTVVLTYSDTTQSAPVTLQLADWFNTPTSDQFVLKSGLNRIQGGITVDPQTATPTLCGSNVAPDPTRSVTAVTVTNAANAGYFVFYGAVAY